MVDAIDAWVDVIFFAVAAASSATAPAELKFPARSVISRRCPETPFSVTTSYGSSDYNRTEVVLVHERRHQSHLALRSIHNTPLLGHRRSSNIFSRDLARARTGQPGGLGN